MAAGFSAHTAFLFYLHDPIAGISPEKAEYSASGAVV
jgi:hypothetical protein